MMLLKHDLRQRQWKLVQALHDPNFGKKCVFVPTDHPKKITSLYIEEQKFMGCVLNFSRWRVRTTRTSFSCVEDSISDKTRVLFLGTTGFLPVDSKANECLVCDGFGPFSRRWPCKLILRGTVLACTRLLDERGLRGGIGGAKSLVGAVNCRRRC